jgi:hypothetical protein
MSHATRGGPATGGNLVLAASLALLSYVPFEYVAKGTLILCVLLFIVDPLPPYSRLLALLATMVVATLTKWHRQWHVVNREHEAMVLGQHDSAESKKED